MNSIFGLFLIILMLTGCANSSVNMNESGMIIGLSQGMGITFNRSHDGSELSILYEQARINYDSNDIATNNKKDRYSTSFTLLTSKVGIPIRYIIRGDLKAPDKNQAKIIFLVGGKKINLPLFLDGSAFFSCFDQTLTEVETLTEWEMELAELKNEGATLIMETIDIAIINSNMPKECTERV